MDNKGFSTFSDYVPMDDDSELKRWEQMTGQPEDTDYDSTSREFLDELRDAP
jgi:hypothetical protein